LDYTSRDNKKGSYAQRTLV
jgi:hypothetical protein